MTGRGSPRASGSRLDPTSEVGSLPDTKEGRDGNRKPSPISARSLREFADALDKDRGHDKSLVTRVMREAADEIERLHSERDAAIALVREAEQMFRNANLGATAIWLEGQCEKITGEVFAG